MIEKVIKDITSTYLPYAGVNLDGFWYDTDYYFESSGAFHLPVEVFRTNKSDSMLEITTKVSDTIQTLHSLNQAIEGVWQKLKFNYFEATSIIWYRERGIFQFVTMPQENGSFVTGKIIIVGGHYSNLVKRYEQEHES